MRLCFADIETYSDTPIKHGTYRYAQDAEVMVWAYAFDDAGNNLGLSDGLKISITYEALESPKEYNFSNDCIYGKISLEHLKAMLEAIPINDWLTFVKEQCTSYDGFISFYPSDFAEWKEPMQEWGEARLGMVLEAYLIHILPRDIDDHLTAWEIMDQPRGNGLIDDLIFTHAQPEFKAYYESLRKD